MTKHLDVERLAREAVHDGAVWIYLSYRRYGLKAKDGEIIAEVHGDGISSDCYFANGKKYHGLEEAQAAAIRALAEGVR